MANEKLTLRKELRYGGYHAIAVEAYSKGANQSSIYDVYLKHIRTAPDCDSEQDPALEIKQLQSEPVDKSSCNCPGRICRLFAVNTGKGIYIQPRGTNSSPPQTPKSGDITNYSFVLVTNDCEKMNECITELENELDLTERVPTMIYSDDEIQDFIDSQLIR